LCIGHDERIQSTLPVKSQLAGHLQVSVHAIRIAQNHLSGCGHVGAGVILCPEAGAFRAKHHPHAAVCMPSRTLALIQHQVKVEGVGPEGQDCLFGFTFDIDDGEKIDHISGDMWAINIVY
jgi:hypothetical protein